MVNNKKWLAALLLALVLHFAVAFVMFNRTDSQNGAKGEGVQGVEINLGMQGSLGEKKVIKKAKPKPKPKPKPKKKRKKKLKKPKPKPIKKVEAKQKTEVVAKLPEIKPVKIVEPKPLVETMPVFEEVEPEPVASAPTEPDQGVEAVTQFKETTGIGSDASSGAKVAAETKYTGDIVAKITKYKRYPRFSRRRHEEGTVVITFTINREGYATSYNITKSSGYPRLDKEVLRMFKKAQPFKPFPPEMTANEIKRTLPISFKLN